MRSARKIPAIGPTLAFLMVAGVVAEPADAESGRFVVEQGSWRLEQPPAADSITRFRVRGAMSRDQSPALSGAALQLEGVLGPQSPTACLAPGDGIFQDSFE